MSTLELEGVESDPSSDSFSSDTGVWFTAVLLTLSEVDNLLHAIAHMLCQCHRYDPTN